LSDTFFCLDSYMPAAAARELREGSQRLWPT